ncbi:chemotaxis protein CheW [Sessilibacter corallicola]|uniref:Chemotaxis protein CheW n=1 Tax=Sessilibacter corallicola TaxID=2904075 RepID=A0ABQ0ABV2_9GAMM|nr:chemotaxis protein CheW [Sessilibacter corallicola]MCE2027257.1 chemotaxis protein CheW [Sessilibacter corallicola]
MEAVIEVPEINTHGGGKDLSLEGIDFISGGDQYLTFCLCQEHYGVDILSVTEIRGWEEPTLIPNSPEYVKGVINLRGVIVPILDLRIRFHIGEADYKPTTVVIVLAVKSEQASASCTMGFVVDAVSDVLNAESDDIKVAPSFGGLIEPNYIQGLVNVGADVVTLLNVDQLVQLDEEGVTNE